MKIEYEYAQNKLALELKPDNNDFILCHTQYVGDPKSIFIRLFFSVRYRVKINKEEAVAFFNALKSREFGRVEVAKNFYVQREKEPFAMLKLKFPQSLENIPIPREALELFIKKAPNEINS